MVLIFTLGNSSDAFLLLKATDANISMVHIPILWMILHVVKAVTSTPGGILSDKIGRKRVIIAGWAVYGIIYIAFALTTTASGIWILFAFYGIYFGLTEGAEKAMVADMVKEDRLGTAYGLFNLAVGLAAFPASVAFGFVWQYLGPKYAFFVGAALALLSSGMLLKVKVKRL